MDGLISVIIPVYNVMAYLEKCLKSVLSQSYGNYEILLIDDGSTDGSSSICDAYSHNEKIRVFHKKNGGLSDARNYGLERCKGEYIFFLDSDDYIEKDTLEVLFDAAEQNCADIVECKVRHVYADDMSKSFVSKRPDVGVYNHEEALYGILDYKFRIVAWNKLYKTDLWKNIRFPIGKNHEDELTIPYVVDNCDKYVVIDRVLYNYVQRSGSIMNSSIDAKRMAIIDGYEDRLNYFRDKYEEKYFSIIIYRYFLMLTKFIVCGQKYNEYEKNNEKFHSLYRKIIVSKNIGWKRKAKATLCRFFPKFSLLLMNKRMSE